MPDLADLSLRPGTLKLFQQRGFTNTAEVERSRENGGLANLAAELGCSLRQANDLFREISGAAQPMGQAKTASQLLNVPNNNAKMGSRKLVTFCRSVDSMLGGGIALGEVTEIAGVPGSGKTQLAMQLSVDARLPIQYGGVEGTAVYIDTEGSFSPERCYTMASALVDHVKKSAEKRKTQCPPTPQWFQPNTIMQGIHVFRAHDEAAQMSIVMGLPDFLRDQEQQGSPVKAVVVDSIAFHYRCAPPGGNYLARTRSLSTVASLLSDMATKFDLAVIVINQMTTKVATTANTTDTESVLVPALGESWAHATTTRLLIASETNNNNNRTCTLTKSPNRPSGVSTFKILEAGIRDIDRH
ncbi:and recombination protein RadA [Seminavis robusta]|uniref:DNA repair protein RAD51 homolog 3 n=1 Tax=Seminavis robusta TaxID=568900 RepID=A0A9N8HU79_9STRA|nr:and recombination protein RadA [Seminavis robusta]|eukprot:Sro1618_g286430.1 and recombination protein RadA (356) ;mRNA; f:14307-15451